MEKFPVWGQGRILPVSPADEGQAAGGSRFPRPSCRGEGRKRGVEKGGKAPVPPPSPRGGSGDAVATEEAASQGFSTWESRGWSPGGTKRRRLARSRHKKGFKKAAPGSQGAPQIQQDPTNGACQGLGGGFTPLWVCPPPPNFFFLPLTMLEKVAEWRETKSFSCSSRLQEARSMSQERIPARGGGTHLSAQPWGGSSPPPPNPPPSSPSHLTATPGAPTPVAHHGAEQLPPAPSPNSTPPSIFWGGDAAAVRTPGARPGGWGQRGGPHFGVPVLGSPFWCRGSANPNLVPWGYGGASPAPLQRH